MNQMQRIRVEHHSNGLGTAGFVTSLVGIVTCGFLCPIGLLMSLIALTKAPRGMAIAGTIVGGLGSLGALIIVLFFGSIVAAIGLGGAAMIEEQEARNATQSAADAIFPAYMASGSIPDSAAGDAAVKAIDPAFGYEREDDEVFYITHPGDDGVAGTEDDVRARWNAAVETIGMPSPANDSDAP